MWTCTYVLAAIPPQITHAWHSLVDQRVRSGSSWRLALKVSLIIADFVSEPTSTVTEAETTQTGMVSASRWTSSRASARQVFQAAVLEKLRTPAQADYQQNRPHIAISEDSRGGRHKSIDG
eukprot:52532-Eustigmatos_ZCMA.PRE.2